MCTVPSEMRSQLAWVRRDEIYALRWGDPRELAHLAFLSPHLILGLRSVVSKIGREGNELIVCDLTGTGAQDAAIGQVAWEKLSKL